MNSSISPSPNKLPNRWIVCLLGIALQICLGTAYAWSYFQKPLGDAFGHDTGFGSQRLPGEGRMDGFFMALLTKHRQPIVKLAR